MIKNQTHLHLGWTEGVYILILGGNNSLNWKRFWTVNSMECDDSGVVYDTSLLPLALLLAKLSFFFHFLLINTMNFNANNNIIVQDHSTCWKFDLNSNVNFCKQLNCFYFWNTFIWWHFLWSFIYIMHHEGIHKYAEYSVTKARITVIVGINQYG